MAKKCRTTKEKLIEILRDALKPLQSLQGIDRRGDGYLKQRSREHICAAIDDACFSVLDAILFVEPQRVKIHEHRVYSKAERQAVQAAIGVYIAKYAAAHGAKKLRKAA